MDFRWWIKGYYGGRKRTGCLFFILILGLAIYLSFKILPPWVDYYFLKDIIEQQTELAKRNSDAEILQTILREVRFREIPITEKDIEIERIEKEQITIFTDYTIEVILFGRYVHQIDFNIESNKSLE